MHLLFWNSRLWGTLTTQEKSSFLDLMQVPQVKFNHLSSRVRKGHRCVVKTALHAEVKGASNGRFRFIGKRLLWINCNWIFFPVVMNDEYWFSGTEIAIKKASSVGAVGNQFLIWRVCMCDKPFVWSRKFNYVMCMICLPFFEVHLHTLLHVF